MNFQSLRTFQAAAREENLSTTAERLNITQPALSRTIRQLEDELEFELFDHIGNRIRLNSNGREFLRTVDSILAQYDASINHIREKNGIYSNSLIISFSSVGNTLPELVHQFKLQHPEAWFELRSYHPGSYDNESNFYFFSRVHQLPPDPTCICIGMEPLFITVSPDSQLASRSSIALSELQSRSFLTADRDNDMHEIQKYYCERAGFTPLIDNIIEKQHILLKCVQMGDGITLLPRIPEYGLVQLPISDMHCVRYNYMRRNGDSYQTILAKKFEHVAIDYYRKLFPDPN